MTLDDLTPRSRAYHEKHAYESLPQWVARMEARAADLEARETYVYRAFDAADRLLYVGCSVNVESRMANHRSLAPWHRFMVRHTVVAYPSRSAALAAEAAAIESEHPFFNARPEDTRAIQANRNEARRLLALRGIPRPAYFDDDASEEETNAAADEFHEQVHIVQIQLSRTGLFPLPVGGMGRYLEAVRAAA